MNIRLFELMEERNMQAQMLSKETGISTGNISDWKKGRSLPSLNALITLADYFEVSIDYLVGRTDDPTLHKKS